MGLFDRILGRKEPEIERKPVSLEEVRGMCKIEIDKISTLDHEKIRQIFTDMKNTINLIVRNLDGLKSARLDESIDKRLKAVVRQSRKQFSLKTKKALSNIKFHEKYDYDSLLEFHKTLENSLKKITKGNKKHSYYISLVFRDRMIRIGKSINSFSFLAIDLGKYISELSPKRKLYEKVLEKIKVERGLETEIKRLERSAEKSEQKKKVLEKDKIKIMEEKPRVSHEEYEDKLKKLEKERSKIESEMHSLLGVFSRPFRKYQKIGVFKKKVELILKDYLNQPVKTAFSDDENILGKILDGIENLMEKDELGLKKSTKTKALSTIKRIRSGELRSLVSRYKKAGKEIEKLEKKIKPLADKQRKDTAELESKKEALGELDSKIKTLGENLADKKEKLEDSRKTLQKHVASLPGHFKIEF